MPRLYIIFGIMLFDLWIALPNCCLSFISCTDDCALDTLHTTFDCFHWLDTNSIHSTAPNAFEICRARVCVCTHKTSNQADSKSKTDNLISRQGEKTGAWESNWKFCQSNWRCQVSKNAICTASARTSVSVSEKCAAQRTEGLSMHSEYIYIYICQIPAEL